MILKRSVSLCLEMSVKYLPYKRLTTSPRPCSTGTRTARRAGQYKQDAAWKCDHLGNSDTFFKLPGKIDDNMI